MRRDVGPADRGAGLRVVVACDKFKECMTAAEANAAIAAGIRRAAPEADVDVVPMADGGEGTAEAMAAGGGRVIEREVTGPLPGSRTLGRITLLADGETAVLDMASAAGIALLAEADRDPTRTTSYGVGELVRYATEMGCKHVVVGLGGSATCDAGMGAAQAVGLHVQTDAGPLNRPVTGADLASIVNVDVPTLAHLPHRTRITCLCDVNAPLFGPNGAAWVYAPQKGATPEQVAQLDVALERLAGVCRRVAMAAEPGMGAAGGLGFGLALAAKAELRPGVEAVADAYHLAQRLDGTQLCVTGEGRFDAQSLGGKVPHGVARICAARDVPCVVISGSHADYAELEPALDTGVSAFFSIADGPADLKDLMARGRALLSARAEQIMRFYLAAGSRAARVPTMVL